MVAKGANVRPPSLLRATYRSRLRLFRRPTYAKKRLPKESNARVGSLQAGWRRSVPSAIVVFVHVAPPFVDSASNRPAAWLFDTTTTFAGFVGFMPTTAPSD